MSKLTYQEEFLNPWQSEILALEKGSIIECAYLGEFRKGYVFENDGKVIKLKLNGISKTIVFDYNQCIEHRLELIRGPLGPNTITFRDIYDNIKEKFKKIFS